jgi:hypothetical protein
MSFATKSTSRVWDIVDEKFLISLSLLKYLSADATVDEIVNNILKLTHTFGNISQSL